MTTLLRRVGPLLAALLTPLILTPAARAELSDYVAPVPVASFSYSAGAGASSPSTVTLYGTGSAWAYVTTTTTTHRLSFRVTADQCEGAPTLGVAVDGVTYLTREIDGQGTYAAAGTWTPGRHQVTFRYPNDHHTSTCDRNLHLRQVQLSAYSDGTVHGVASQQQAELQYAVLPAGSGDTAPYGQVQVVGDGTVHVRQDSQGARSFSAFLFPTDCAGRRASLVLTVDGTTYFSGPMVDTGGTGVTFVDVDRTFANGVHDIALTFSGVSTAGGCTTSVIVQGITFAGWV